MLGVGAPLRRRPSLQSFKKLIMVSISSDEQPRSLEATIYEQSENSLHNVGSLFNIKILPALLGRERETHNPDERIVRLTCARTRFVSPCA